MKSDLEQTEIEALYELPEGWKWCRLGDFINIFRGVSYKKNDAHNEKQENDCLIIRGGNIDEGCINLNSDNVFVNKSLVSENQIIKKNDVIIVTSTGSIKVIGRAGVSASDYEDVAFGAFLTLARPNEKTNKSFVNQYFQSSLYRERIRQLASGVNINNIRIEYITESPFPLPPTLAEQQRIVNRIESMFAKLDEAKEKAQNVVDGFETRKAAILHKAFTGELTAKWRKENGVSDDSWEIVKLEDIVKKEKNSLKAGPFGSALKKDFYVSKGYKIYGQEQVLNSDENYGDYFIDEDKYKELESCKVAPNDILISLVGTVGKTLILSDKCKPGIINPRLIKISLDVNLMITQFFTYYFGSDYCKSKYMAVQHGTTMDVLNMGILKQLEYPCCTLPEQVEIVRILDIIIEKENKAKQAAETVLEQIDLLKKSILARAFRGEL